MSTPIMTLGTPIMTLEEAISIIGEDLGHDLFHHDMSGSMSFGPSAAKEAKTLATVYGSDEDHILSRLNSVAEVTKEHLFAVQAANIRARS